MKLKHKAIAEPGGARRTGTEGRAWVKRVMLQNFRNYAALDLNLSAQSTILVGPNGAGKTNILEALSLLGPGRGLRGAALDALATKDGHDRSDGMRAWAVSAEIASGGFEAQLGTGSAPQEQDEGARRSFRVNGTPVPSPIHLTEYVQIVWVTPAQDRLFMDGLSDRRRFFDRLIASFEPGHAAHWATYEKAMRERARLLREVRPDAAWLASVERTMAEHATALSAARWDAVRKLNAVIAGNIGAEAFPCADIWLDGSVEDLLLTHASIDAEDAFAATLAAARMRDAESGRTAHGPHATDFVVRHRQSGRPARECSTGEQKALLIRLVLAAAEIASWRMARLPIVLLDEVAAHFDPDRRAALFHAIELLDLQAWMTGTEIAPFSALRGRAQFLTAGGGMLRPETIA